MRANYRDIQLPKRVAGSVAPDRDGLLGYDMDTGEVLVSSGGLWLPQTPGSLLSFTDTFNRADGPVGNGWSQIFGAVTPVIAGNALTTGIDGEAEIILTPQNLTNDHYAQAVINNASTIGTDPRGVTLLVRVVNAHNFYGLRIQGNTWAMFRRVGGVNASLGNGTFNGVPVTARLAIAGATLSAQINGVEVASVTDTTFPTSQLAGLRIRGPQLNISIDSFTASEI